MTFYLAISSGWRLRRLTALLSITRPQGPECVQSFHISAATKLIVRSQFPGKSIYVSVDSVTGTERIRAAALM